MTLHSLPLSQIRPYPRNARLHPGDQLQRLGDSLRRFGFVAPVLVDAEDVLVAGHARLEAAKRIWAAGLTIPRAEAGIVPVVRLADLTPAQIRAYRIADNKLAQLSHFDDALLSETLRVLTSAGFGAAALGFSDDELALLTGTTQDDNATPVLDPDAPVLPADMDPYSLIQFSCIVGTDQKQPILDALYAGMNRYGVSSIGEALVATCRRYAAS